MRPLWSFESDSSAAVRAAPTEGLGIAVLPLHAATPPPDGTVLRRATDLAITLPVGLVTRPATTPPAPSLGLLLERLRRELAEPGDPDGVPPGGRSIIGSAPASGRAHR